MRKFVGVSLALVGVSLGFACGDDDDSSPINTQGTGGSSIGGSAGVSGTGGGNPAGAAGSPAGAAGSPAGAAGSPAGAAGSPAGSGGSAGGTPFVPTCTTAGTGATRVLKGRVVAPDQVFEQGEVVIGTDGLISCVGADCSAAPGYAESTTVSCTGGVITPSLINTHDHITFAQNKPKPHTAKYNHRNEWRRGAGQDLPKITVPGGNGNDTVAWGELRFVMGGATSTVGSGGVKGMMRNLDRTADQQEGLNQKAVKFETFPLNDSGFDVIPTECLYNGFDTTATVTAEEAYLPHISEGINNGAHNEFDCIKGFGGAPADYLQKQTAIVHAIGLKASDAALMSAEGVGVIWSPRSNIDLYGVTANVVQFAKLGVQVALGTDWSASGSYNLLRELACADSYNTKNLGGAFTSHDLYRMVTENAAAVLASDDKIGSLKVGLVGDVTIWAGTGKVDPYEAVTKANLPDVLLVMRSGIALYGEPAAVDALSPDAGVGCELVGDGGLTDVCGVARKVCAKREFGKSIAELRASISKNGSAELYNLYYCDSAAAAEPSCLPSRPGEFTGEPSVDDTDGDGIPNTTDLCPTIFSPTRPMDGGVQADGDADGAGDACDPCPFKANSDDCPLVSGDIDADGVPDTSDVCPDIPNPGQEDADGDLKGDLCDDCPDKANPGLGICPGEEVTVAQAKAKPLGAVVTIRNAIVSAIDTTGSTRGFWVQDANAGLFGFTGTSSPTVVPGDIVDVTAVIGEFSGLKQLNSAFPVKTGTGAVPAPLVVDPASVATGGADRDKYMSMLISVANVSVVNQNADGPADDFDEFAVTGNLRVDDFIFDYDNASFPVGTNFAQITGPLHFSFNNSKLLPRTVADVTPLPPALRAPGAR